MNSRLLPPVFSATLFISAFLIFAVQPMASKMMLPLLGGSPAVWNTAMVFFQAMLLCGYAYAHFIARFIPLKIQAVLHLGLLAVFTLVLPLSIPTGSIAPEDSGQALWQLGLMLTCIGGPFFILAASAPLFQHWFSASGHKDAENPYFLYAVSNIGSMGALLAYPLLIEPLLTLPAQTNAWFAGYAVLIALTGFCAYMVKNGKKPLPPLTSKIQDTVTWKTRLVWIVLAFIPSSLMLGVTTMITTDLASAPMIWVVPLALYLGTFIIAFARKPPLDLLLTRELAAFSLCLTLFMFMISAFVVIKVVMILVHLSAFFLCALFCHTQLAQNRPRAAHLTEFFLLMSFGGVLGGIFNALIAPTIFSTPLEYPLALATVPFVIWASTAGSPSISMRFNTIEDKNRLNKVRAVNVLMIAVGLGLCAAAYFTANDFLQVIFVIALFCYLFLMVRERGTFALICLVSFLTFQNGFWNLGQEVLARDRNYFGSIKVTEKDNARFFYHGTTLHGAQPLDELHRLKPVTYYSPEGPAFDIFHNLEKYAGHRIAGVGLGVGSIACFTASGRYLDFYEIDSDVVTIAQDPKYFTYLSDCGTDHTIILGDGRLKISQQIDETYDLIFLDAFSSDNIPIHLMTREAMEIYLKKLKPHGYIGMNISNRYLDLRPMLTSLAKDMGLVVAFKFHQPEKSKESPESLYTPSMFAVLSTKPENIATLLEEDGWEPYSGKKTARAWTDDYANILSSLIGLN